MERHGEAKRISARRPYDATAQIHGQPCGPERFLHGGTQPIAEARRRD